VKAAWVVPVVLAALPGSASAAPLVTTDPPLQPKFAPRITDYAVRCPERTVAVSGRRYEGPESVALEPGQAFSFRVRHDGLHTRHFVRCLPDDFPSFFFRGEGRQKPRWYLLTPGVSFSSPVKPFVTIFDQHGAPLWWYRSPSGQAHDARLIDGSIAYAEAPPGGIFNPEEALTYRIRAPDGTLVRSLQAVGVPTDFHDFQPLGRGFLVLTYHPRPHADLSAYGGPTDATVLDSEIQHISRRGRLLWSWNSKDHIDFAETGRWWPFVVGNPQTLPDGTQAYDTTHINSIEVAGEDLIVSLRHTDAVYRIRMTGGRVRWKLGGTETPRSLRVVADPADDTFGGQHDARLWNGTLTVHDNATDLGRPPRAVRYAIDTKRRTATLLESVTDPRAPSSLCCGSARKLDDGNWLIGWGGVGTSSLLTPHGRLIGRFTFEELFSYRTIAQPESAVERADLRAGMDALYAAGEAD
jgi:Arylsulfotransferase (ASST)